MQKIKDKIDSVFQKNLIGGFNGINISGCRHSILNAIKTKGKTFQSLNGLNGCIKKY